MKNLSEWRWSPRERECEYSFRILEPHEAYRLEALYCTLDTAARRRRFCGGVSDASIRSHCESLAAKRALVIGAFQSNRMDAAIEILPFSAAWEEAEIAMAYRVNAGRPLETLMRLAAQEARRRRCATLLAVFDGDDPALLPVLASLGEVELDGDIARIDISDFGPGLYDPALRELDFATGRQIRGEAKAPAE
jgi:hypothetical protein